MPQIVTSEPRNQVTDTDAAFRNNILLPAEQRGLGSGEAFEEVKIRICKHDGAFLRRVLDAFVFREEISKVFGIAVGFAGNRKQINDFVTAAGQGNQPRINMALQLGQII
jgi:hypothetical protein